MTGGNENMTSRYALTCNIYIFVFILFSFDIKRAAIAIVNHQEKMTKTSSENIQEWTF